MVDAQVRSQTAGRVAAPPLVLLGDGRRPETGTHVRIETFDGPLALLLALIEARRLDVLTVPLGALADAYLDALAMLDVDRLGHVSAFVAVASQLILIKSRALLPRREDSAPAADVDDETPDPEADLRARLLVYRAYRAAGSELAARALERIGLFRREPRAARSAAFGGARPADGSPIAPAVLATALAGLIRIVPPRTPPPEAVPSTITLGERASIIRSALRGAGPIVLQELLRGVRDRLVVVVTFLAVLELVKRREIAVDQAEPWGPIVVRETTIAERAAAGFGPAMFGAPHDEFLESLG